MNGLSLLPAVSLRATSYNLTSSWSSSVVEYVEEISGQLWSIPKPERARGCDPLLSNSRLVWIRRDLIRESKVRPEDYFPMSRTQRIDHTPRVLSYLRDLCPIGDRPTFVEVLKRIPMAAGGKWV
jgi:hypothetical protein